MAFDNTGVVRYLDTNVRFTVQYKGNAVVFTLSRSRGEIGQLSLVGDMLTVWEE